MDLLTTGEAAELLRTNTNSLAYWRMQGTGPRWAKIGRRVMYRRSDLEDFVAASFEGVPA